MASKECQQCAAEGRGKVQITQKDKKKGGQYWANPDSSPHFFHTGDVNDKPQFAHPRTKDEFNWAKEHNGMNSSPSYKTKYEELGIKQDTPKDWKPWLTPGTPFPDIQKTAIGDCNLFIQNCRQSAFDLAKDLQPDDADYRSIQITACGFIHDFVNVYAAELIKQDLLKVEKIVDSTMKQITKKG